MAAFPAGVTIVTATDADRRPCGLTVTAFCPVSASPPLVLVCLDHGSTTLGAIRHCGGFTVNFIAEAGLELARLCATKREDKLESVPWRAAAFAEAGPVLLEGAIGHLACRVRESAVAGDHVIVIGEVVEGEVQAQHRPLLYSRRSFGSWAALPV